MKIFPSLCFISQFCDIRIGILLSKCHTVRLCEFVEGRDSLLHYCPFSPFQFYCCLSHQGNNLLVNKEHFSHEDTRFHNMINLSWKFSTPSRIWTWCFQADESSYSIICWVQESWINICSGLLAHNAVSRITSCYCVTYKLQLINIPHRLRNKSCISKMK